MTGTALMTATDRPTLVSAHGNLEAWIDTKIAALAGELAEMATEHERALERKWAVKPFERQMDKTSKHLAYLRKVKAALAAGYSIIPNLRIDVLAVRVNKNPRHLMQEVEERPSVSAEKLPIGDGTYVSPSPEYRSWQIERPNRNGQGTHHVTIYETTDHAPVDIPHVLMKRDLADALHLALEQKLFDEIGIVRDTPRGDPVLVGRILSTKASGWNRDGVAFFIGWWFDPKVLEA